MMDNFVGIVFYGIFLLFCFFLLPAWAFFERKRKVLALVLLCIGLFFAYLIYGYMTDPRMKDDHGAVIAGFLFYVPPFAFLCQLLVYIGYKITRYISEKKRKTSALTNEKPLIAHIPVQISRDDERLASILKLIQVSFSYMDDRINPRSSMHKLKLADVAQQCETGEVWAIGDPVKACMFLTDMEDSLLLGKLAVAENERGNGLARELVKVAEGRVKLRGKKYLELLTRVELVENHQAFSRLGFEKVGEGTHAGFDRPTYIRMTKQVQG